MRLSRAALAVPALLSLIVLDATPGAADVIRPWCAQYVGSRDGATNCGFISYDQCMMTARGAGAYCVQNPWYLYGPRRQPRKW
jgi:hypothetical protein